MRLSTSHRLFYLLKPSVLQRQHPREGQEFKSKVLSKNFLPRAQEKKFLIGTNISRSHVQDS